MSDLDSSASDSSEHEESGTPAEGRSPRVTDLAWGRLAVEGRDRPYKDAKLWPGGHRAWDWSETGTSHAPGIQIDDVRELVAHDARTVVLSRGMNRRLQVREETLQWLRDHDVETEVLQTEDAVTRYNELSEEEKVGALIHTTC